MRLAIFSDVHGNPFALEAVLQAIRQAGDFDALVAAGDLCLGGSSPGNCVEMLRLAGAKAVYGNTDEYLHYPERVPNDELHQNMWQTIEPVARWSREQLSSEQREWLFGLPFELRFPVDDDPAHDLLVVHANPKDVELMILPPEPEQIKLWGEVRQPDDSASLKDVLADEPASTVAFGHFHYTFQRKWNEKTLVDVACCALPSIDHDLRARFTVFEWDGAAWRVEPHWVPYDFAKEVAAIKAGDMPSQENFLRYYA